MGLPQIVATILLKLLLYSSDVAGEERNVTLFIYPAALKLYQLGLKMGCKILCVGVGDGGPYDFLCEERRPVTDEQKLIFQHLP